MYALSAPALHNQPATAALAAANPAAIHAMPAGSHNAHTAATSRPLGLIQNATAASAPLQKGRRRYAIQTAARCGASISRSDATGITADGKSKIRKIPNSPAAYQPSRSDHRSRAKRQAIQQARSA